MDRVFSLADLKNTDLNNISLVDIRTKELYAFGTIPGAINIPAIQPQNLYELPADKKVYIFCQSGEISGEYVGLLRDAGYDAYHLPDGYLGYLKSVFEESVKGC